MRGLNRTFARSLSTEYRLLRISPARNEQKLTRNKLWSHGDTRVIRIIFSSHSRFRFTRNWEHSCWKWQCRERESIVPDLRGLLNEWSCRGSGGLPTGAGRSSFAPPAWLLAYDSLKIEMRKLAIVQKSSNWSLGRHRCFDRGGRYALVESTSSSRETRF